MENNTCSNDLPYFDSACNDKYVAPESPFIGATFHKDGRTTDRWGVYIGEWKDTETGIIVVCGNVTHNVTFK